MLILFGNLETHSGLHIVQLISWECLLCLDPQTKIKHDNWIILTDSRVKRLNVTSLVILYVYILYEIHFTWSRDGSFIHLSSISSFLKFQNDVNITDANFYANITEKKLAEILKSDSDTPIPLLEERVAVLREAGKVLLEVNEKSKLMYTSIERCFYTTVNLVLKFIEI